MHEPLQLMLTMLCLNYYQRNMIYLNNIEMSNPGRLSMFHLSSWYQQGFASHTTTCHTLLKNGLLSVCTIS